MGIARQLMRAALTSSLPASRWLVRGPRRGTSPAIALTFDDGPHPEHTPRVLEALRRWNAVGTFFVVGGAAARHPELIAQIVVEGHLLGNHTWTHGEPREASTSEFLAEIEQTDRWLCEQTHEFPYWMRPPKGELSLTKLWGIWQLSHGVALWNVDPRDYRMTDDADAVSWAEHYQPQAGDVVLLHDRCAAASVIVDTLGQRGLLASLPSRSLDAWRHTARSVCLPGKKG